MLYTRDVLVTLCDVRWSVDIELVRYSAVLSKTDSLQGWNGTETTNCTRVGLIVVIDLYQCFSTWGSVASWGTLGNIWRQLLIITTGRQCCWHVVGRGQGRH